MGDYIKRTPHIKCGPCGGDPNPDGQHFLDYFSEEPRQADPRERKVPAGIRLCLWAEIISMAIGLFLLTIHPRNGEVSLALYAGLVCFLLSAQLAVSILAQIAFLVIARQQYRAAAKSLAYFFMITLAGALAIWQEMAG